MSQALLLASIGHQAARVGVRHRYFFVISHQAACVRCRCGYLDLIDILLAALIWLTWLTRLTIIGVSFRARLELFCA